MVRTLGAVLYSREQIAARVQELAQEIGRDFARKEVTFLIVLKGAACFGVDLARAMTLPVCLDFLPATSYRGTWSSGAPSIGPLQPAELEGRTVLIVEDILDTGVTLHTLWRHVQDLAPAEIHVCTLFDKATARGIAHPVPIRYVGFEISDQFVVGYGMDLEEEFRHLPDVHVLD